MCSENMTTTFLSEIERTSNPMYYVVLSKIDPSYMAGCHNGLWSLHKTILSFQHFFGHNSGLSCLRVRPRANRPRGSDFTCHGKDNVVIQPNT